MIAALKRETTTITIANFWENYLLEKYEFNPPFQRKSIWTEEKQSFFIDSVMRNYPIPPIFLHQKIDVKSGKTVYDIVDGRQRLESIVRFIKGEIPVTAEQGDDNPLSGAYFSDLDRKELQEYKMNFWRYSLPVEYIDTSDKALIDSIFDRLNRNGERLEGQELRHASYHNSLLLKLIQTLADYPYWRPHLDKLNVKRMEDIEFVSEMVFAITEGGVQEADQKLLDEKYEKYAGDNSLDTDKIAATFEEISQFVEGMKLDIDKHKIAGASHLYGIWTFAIECVKRKADPKKVGPKLDELFSKLRAAKSSGDALVEEYRKSMSYATRSKSQRLKRLNALLRYAGLE